MTETEIRSLGKRYELLQQLGRGGMGIVYRALDRLTNQYVALKYVLPPSTAGESEHLSSAPMTDLPTASVVSAGTVVSLSDGSSAFSETHAHRLALAQEFRTLASLRHPNIISVLDYGFDERQQPFFTMELLEHPQAISEAGQNQPLSVQAGMFAQLLRALSYLHRRGILHRDLKPSNVFVVEGAVKVLDFGIAVHRTQVGNLAGTLEYMAPELLLGQPASVASDMYAVGVIMYQMLSGQSPYTRESITRMLSGKLGTADLTLPPHVLAMLESAGLSARDTDQMDDWNPGEDIAQEEDALTLQGPLAPIIIKLLSRQPGDRYQDAIAALRDLGTAIGEPIALETASTRDSFLQASQFVGREAEMERLSSALSRSTTGEGSGWLLGGESGVGKSRLLDEIRTLALVRGALVMRGQAVSAGSAAYQVWRDVLRLLCLHIHLEDLEASVLKPLVPNLERLRGRPVPDAPELDAQATQQRLMNVVSAAFARLKEPVVLILEDLHWSGPESIALLQRIIENIGKRPWLVIGSYRDDEMPGLTGQLSAMQLLRLQRFGRTGITALCEAMLGDAGRQPKLAKLIEHETEGNVFFIIEVMRALAEESGMLSEVGRGALPHSVFAGGIKAVIQRRLTRVPASARPMLQLAAIAGRKLDLNVMRLLEPKLDAWLTACGEVAVLEVSDQEWRFSHDKLRESLVAELDPAEAKRLHKSVAEAIETAYSDRNEHAAMLAYHYSQSGDLATAARYAIQAGDVALRNGALTEAVTHLKQAQSLQQKVSLPVLQQARMHRLLVKALLGLGQLPECAEHFEQSMEVLGFPMPKDGLKLKLATLREAARQFVYRTKPERLPQPTEEELALLRELVELSEGCDVYAWLGFQDELGYALLRLLNAAEAVDDNHRRAWLYPFLGYAGSLTPIKALCDFYMKKTQELLPQVPGPRSENQYLRMRGLVELQTGHWADALKIFERGLTLTREMGDDAMSLFNLVQLASIPFYAGDYSRALTNTETLYQAAEQAHNTQFQFWALVFRSAVWACRGDFAKALVLAEDATRIPRSGRDSQAEMSNKGILAVCLLKQGDQVRAKQLADETLQLILKTAVTGYGGLEGYGIAEVYAQLSKESRDRSVRFDSESKMRQLLKAFHQYGAVISLGKAPAHLWEGRWAWLNGHPILALRHFQQSLQIAQQIKLPYDEAMAHYWLGRLLKDGRLPHWPGVMGDLAQRARNHGEAAVRVFTSLEAGPHIKDAQKLL